MKLRPGQSRTAAVGLNRAGRKLLAKRRRLTVKVTVRAGGRTLSAKSVVLRPKAKHKHA